MAQGSTLFEAAAEYWRDAAQRGVLFMETLNERGNTYVAQSAKTAPHVLNFPVEILRDGRTLERSANYALVRIVPPNDVTIDPMKPPIVVVDPRAGHGPGIGGMKPESEIGVALRAGHPVYFIGFLPKPEPGQTIEDVCRAEGTFIEDVAQRHPERRLALHLSGVPDACRPGHRQVADFAVARQLARQNRRPLRRSDPPGRRRDRHARGLAFAAPHRWSSDPSFS
jgi:Protein of unknown function (DUF3141)